MNNKKLSRRAWFVQLQQELGDYFSYYRQGKYRQWKYTTRNRVFLSRRHPKPGRWLGTLPRETELEEGSGGVMSSKNSRGESHNNLSSNDKEPENPGVVYNAWPAQVRDVGGTIYRQGAAAAAKPLAEQIFERTGGRLRFNRILGFGGMGVVALFNTVDATGTADKYFVVKSALVASRRHDIRKERRWHRALTGTKHVVQSLDMPWRSSEGSRKRQYIDPEDEEYSPNRRKGPKTAAKKKRPQTDDSEDDGGYDTSDDNLLVLEYCPRGDLNNALVKLQQSQDEKPIPDMVLWAMFRCLWKGCIAMAYPPGNSRTYKEGTIVDEKIRTYPPGYFVHFDLDPRNILLGDYDKAEHSGVPVLKIADLGLMMDMELGENTDNAKTMWLTRQRGKPGWYTPEQFTAEWDHISGTPDSAEIAGQYSYKTNIYQIGQIMWCLVTRCRPPDGPIAEIDDDIWSYGYSVSEDDYKQTDPKIRLLISRCMADSPDNRPNLREIGEAIKEGITAQLYMGQTFDHARAWSDEHLPSADLPPARDPEELQQWLDDEMSKEVQEKWVFGQ